MIKRIIISLLLLLSSKAVLGQCCASSGNPIGGTVNIGLLNKNTLRFAGFFQNSFSDKYLKGNKIYNGELAILKRAEFNYIGFFTGYGISNKMTLEIEAGYYINKIHSFKNFDENLVGHGFSDAVISLKPMIYSNPDKNIEISCALGTNIPFSRKLLQINGVTLPIELQPSTGSFGLVFQSNIIKDNTFRSMSFLITNRIEKYFENKQSYIIGNVYTNSLFWSKFFFFQNKQLEGLTLVLQLKNQIKKRNTRSERTIEASGYYSLFFVPQFNLSIYNTWNISMLSEIPVYQYYNEIQHAKKLAFALIINKDLSLN